MQSVTVSKENLLATMKKNREEHRDVFLRAQEVYRQRVIEELDRRLNDAKNGRPLDLVFRLPVPEDHTDDYDAAIQAVSWHIEDNIELEWDTFQMYVLNRWHWARAFAANTGSYLAQ